LARRAFARVLLVAGAGALAAAAFLHGSLLVGDGSAAVLVGLRLGGITAVAASIAGWRVARSARAAAAVGVLTLAASEGLVAAELDAGGDVARGIGAVLFGVGLVLAS